MFDATNDLGDLSDALREVERLRGELATALGLLRAAMLTSEGCEELDGGESPCGFCFDCQIRALLAAHKEVQGC